MADQIEGQPDVEFQLENSQDRGPIRLDTKISWFVSVCSCLANIIIDGSLVSYAILFPKIMEEFQEGKARTGKRSLCWSERRPSSER